MQSPFGAMDKQTDRQDWWRVGVSFYKVTDTNTGLTRDTFDGPLLDSIGSRFTKVQPFTFSLLSPHDINGCNYCARIANPVNRVAPSLG